MRNRITRHLPLAADDGPHQEQIDEAIAEVNAHRTPHQRRLRRAMARLLLLRLARTASARSSGRPLPS